jgi:E3 ubiquitin-protein ligase RFWD2
LESVRRRREGGREEGKQAGRQAEMDVVQFTESSVGLQVPSVIGAVKDEPHSGSWSSDDHQRRGGDSSSSSRIKVELDKDFLCPICIQTMKDAFLTSCGHSFCYMCIMTHLGNRSNCPCCGLYLTNNKLFPNFLLNKLMKKASASQLVSNASPAEQLRLALQQGVNLPVKELDSLLQLLADKKRKAEQEEAEANMEILLDFLLRSWQQKQEVLHKVRLLIKPGYVLGVFGSHLVA